MDTFINLIKICSVLDKRGDTFASDLVFNFGKKYANYLAAPFVNFDIPWQQRMLDYSRFERDYEDESSMRQELHRNHIPDTIYNIGDLEEENVIDDGKGKKRKLVGPTQMNKSNAPEGIKNIIQDNSRDVSTRTKDLSEYAYDKVRPDNLDESFKKFMLI